MEGTIYLIQPAELLGTNRYKVGCSAKNDLNRCKTGYRNGTRYLHIMACNEPFKIEAKIKELFKEKFSLIAGREYFEGDETEIKTEFYNIVNKYINTSNNSITNNITNTGPDKKFKCKLCPAGYSDFYTYKKHMTTKHIPQQQTVEQQQVSPVKNTNKKKTKSPRQVKCDVCGNTFLNKYNLKRHVDNSCNPTPEQLLKGLKPGPALSILTALVKSGCIGGITNNTQNNNGILNTNNGTINNDNRVLNRVNNINNPIIHINPLGQ